MSSEGVFLSGWFFLLILAGAGLVWLVAFYVLGAIRLCGALRDAAGGSLKISHLSDLPIGLRSAERDLKALASQVEKLNREASRDRRGLHAVLGSLPEGVFTIDLERRIRLVNPALESMFYLSVAPSGRTVMEAFRLLELHQLVEKGLISGQPQRAEIELKKGTTVRIFAVSVSSANFEDGEVGVLVSLHDITKTKMLERGRREFVDNVSHELRTPLTIINGYLETLIDGGFDDRAMVEKSLRVMFRHGDRLKRLVDELLIISQVESGSLPLAIQSVDLADLAHLVVEQFDDPIRVQGVQMQVIAVGHLLVDAHPAWLEKVFFNLLGNALKYGSGQALRVDLCLERIGSDVHIRFTDNGPGIPYADQGRIFERFYRVHKHRSRDTGGTGLGLSIVKNIMQAHGGSVSLQSVPGSGSTFHLTLPVRPPRYLGVPAG